MKYRRITTFTSGFTSLGGFTSLEWLQEHFAEAGHGPEECGYVEILSTAWEVVEKPRTERAVKLPRSKRRAYSTDPFKGAASGGPDRDPTTGIDHYEGGPD